MTHHAPDLDAAGAVWILKRFDSENFADARVAFVNPGERLSLKEAKSLGTELHEVTHVDTGMGRFDHHQPENGKLHISAASLTYDYCCAHNPDLSNNQALQLLVEYITDIDHFQEIYWPISESFRENFMLHNVLHGYEFLDMHDDESQLNFGLTCLDCVYACLVQYLAAAESIKENGIEFTCDKGRKCLGIESRNDSTIKLAQKQGYTLVVRKDPKEGHMRIKARPDTDLSLQDLYQRILEKDDKGTWFYHPSGKMLINGSRKHQSQVPTPLTLEQVIDMIKELYE